MRDGRCCSDSKKRANTFRINNTRVKMSLDTNPDDSYSFLLEHCNENGERTRKEYKNRSLREMISDLYWFITRAENEGANICDFDYIMLVESPSDLLKNPLYQYALASDDERFQLKLKLHYQQASNEECERYSELSGKRILPALPGEFNMYFAVFPDGVDSELLTQSGYRILRVPRFYMKGKTHDMWTINPHTKFCKDAAPIDAEGISFEVFMNLFKEC